VLIGAVNVIKDTDDPDPARHYKMVYQFFPDQADPSFLSMARGDHRAGGSPDGLHWGLTGIPFKDQFVEQSSFIRHNGQYIVHYR